MQETQKNRRLAYRVPEAMFNSKVIQLFGEGAREANLNQTFINLFESELGRTLKKAEKNRGAVSYIRIESGHADRRALEKLLLEKGWVVGIERTYFEADARIG